MKVPALTGLRLGARSPLPPLFALLAALGLLQGCEGAPSSEDLTPSLPDVGTSDPVNPEPAPTSPPSDGNVEPAPAYAGDVLLFNGTGVSTSDWQNTEKIVAAQGWRYRLVNSSQLAAMSLDEMARYRVLVVPGGKGATITNSLPVEARLRVRRAVRERGLGYVGFCAGAWVAVGPEAETMNVAGYGLAVAKGAVLPSFFPDGDTSLTAAMAPVKFADGSVRELVWWGGPSTPEWPGGVVARYDTGVPAISQTRSGAGYVVISGPHPEAPQAWRATAGYDSDGLDYDVAIEMIRAAMSRVPMPAF
jgi:glutamine amidotransferase-like uncharacterized protein